MSNGEDIDAAVARYEDELPDALWAHLGPGDDCIAYSALTALAQCDREPTGSEARHLGECVACRSTVIVHVCGKPVVGHPLLKEDAWNDSFAGGQQWSRIVDAIRTEAPRTGAAYPSRRIIPFPRTKTMRIAAAIAGIAAVAACVLFLIVPRATLSIDKFSLSVPTVRSGVSLEFEIELGLSEAGYVRVIVIDNRYEHWIMPFDEEQYVRRLDETESLHITARPNPDDPEAKAIFAMVVATDAPSPSGEELDKFIPDPIVAPDADMEILRRALERLRTDLEKKFKCAVRFDRIPAP